MTNGGDYKMMTHVTLSSGNAAAKTTTIDLNDKTLSAKALGAKTGGTLTLKNGKLVQDKKTSTISSLAIAANEYLVDGHEFVDLGLSALWATCNVGATESTGYGNYYAWGEVAEKSCYNWTTYKYSPDGTYKNLTKYKADKKTTLEAEDDAATVNWGAGCRMPTGTEMEELINNNETNCKWEWTTVNEINGYKVTSLKEGYTDKSIFLPASGIFDTSLGSVGRMGYYWSNSLSTVKGVTASYKYYAYSIGFSNTSGKATKSNDFRNTGYPVRPVADKPE